MRLLQPSLAGTVKAETLYVEQSPACEHAVSPDLNVHFALIGGGPWTLLQNVTFSASVVP